MLLGDLWTTAFGDHDNKEQISITRPAINLEGRHEYRSREPPHFYSLRTKMRSWYVGRMLYGSQIYRRMGESSCSAHELRS
jgi:hypothetical protein